MEPCSQAFVPRARAWSGNEANHLPEREATTALQYVVCLLVSSCSSEKLSEYLKFQRHPLICAEVFLSFRVLLLKFSPQHLEAFWPAIVAELVSHLSCSSSFKCM